MKIDRDFVPIAFISALVVVWLSAKPWETESAIAIAGDILKVGLGGVLGYMHKVKEGMESGEVYTAESARVRQLEEENQRLRAQINQPTSNRDEYL